MAKTLILEHHGVVTNDNSTDVRPPYDQGRARSRKFYNMHFKLQVVRWALQLPPSERIKPTARAFPGVEPVRALRGT